MKKYWLWWMKKYWLSWFSSQYKLYLLFTWYIRLVALCATVTCKKSQSCRTQRLIKLPFNCQLSKLPPIGVQLSFTTKLPYVLMHTHAVDAQWRMSSRVLEVMPFTSQPGSSASLECTGCRNNQGEKCLPKLLHGILYMYFKDMHLEQNSMRNGEYWCCVDEGGQMILVWNTQQNDAIVMGTVKCSNHKAVCKRVKVLASQGVHPLCCLHESPLYSYQQ